MKRVAVVIPYFQKEAGILRRAVVSALAQRFDGPMEIVIVDDDSPKPARRELAGLAVPPGRTVRVIRQANGGPGAARNRALLALDDGIDYVAFLDSDDSWAEDHLAEAVARLEQGYDFYFGNYRRAGQEQDFFTKAAYLKEILEAPGQIRPIDAAGTSFAFAGNPLQPFLREFFAFTSSVVYRVQRFRDVRFEETLRGANEDWLFWIDLLLRGARVCFSREARVTAGEGVNIFHSTYGWDTPKNAERLFYLWKGRALAGNRLRDLPDARRTNLQVHRSIEKSLVFFLMRSLVKRIGIEGSVGHTLKSGNPQMLLGLARQMPKLLVELLVNRRPDIIVY